MAQVRFIADLHFYHENCAKHRGFKDANEMNELIVSNWNKVVHKKDVTYIVGDITMEKSNYGILDRLNGIKHVILGNHDKKQHVKKLLEHVNTVAGAMGYKKKFMVTHIPIHPNELRYRFSINIHGHVHTKTIMAYRWDYSKAEDTEIVNPNYCNVSADNIAYTPKTLAELGLIK
tara:strand:+ start:39793 stop:40317 length:525 start_codon:yes stop_codon:yes gene_type:complete